MVTIIRNAVQAVERVQQVHSVVDTHDRAGRRRERRRRKGEEEEGTTKVDTRANSTHTLSFFWGVGPVQDATDVHHTAAVKANGQRIHMPDFRNQCSVRRHEEGHSYNELDFSKRRKN